MEASGRDIEDGPVDRHAADELVGAQDPDLFADRRRHVVERTELDGDVVRHHAERGGHPLAELALIQPEQAAAGVHDDEDLVRAEPLLADDERADDVVGDDAAVVVLIPVGADPHDFQPSARDAAELHDADLIVATGLGLEPGLADMVDSARSEGVPVLEVGEHVDPLPFGDSSAHEGEPGTKDPHFWTDPLRVGVAAEVIAEQLEEVIPGGAWRDNAGAYSEQMTALDASIEVTVCTRPS